MPFTLPRNAQIWLPGYLKSCLGRRQGIKNVYLAICDHFEPLRGNADIKTGLERVMRWRRSWPEIAKRHTDSTGRPAQYTFFYPEEEYRPELMDPLAEMVHQGIADVEIHLHHDGEGEQNFVERMSKFKEVLHHRHGLLRKDDSGRITFGFIHGNWALDNSGPNGRYCGLNNELTLLRNLGCYADFTMPSAPHISQASLVNTIYWATDDPSKPKSYNTGIPFTPDGQQGDILMIPGPIALNWKERSRGLLPRLEVGELAASNPVTRQRVRLWLGRCPISSTGIIVKLFAHGAWESNTRALLTRDLDQALDLTRQEAVANGWNFNSVTAADLRARIKPFRTHIPELISVQPPERRHSS